jgi:glycosyltransferase involved in cell wall biosynthesis
MKRLRESKKPGFYPKRVFEAHVECDDKVAQERGISMSSRSTFKKLGISQVAEILPEVEAGTRLRERLILFVSVSTFYGGGEAHVENVARMLTGSCSLYAIVFHPTLARNLRARGVRVYQLSLFPESARSLQVLHALVMLPRLIRRHNISVVQVTGTIEALLLPISRALGCTSISIRHLVPFLGEGAWHKKLRRLVIEAVYCIGILGADRVICVSETVGRGMRRMTSGKRIAVIPNWIPVMPPRELRGTQNFPLRLLFVGRLERHKGLHLLIEALREISGYELSVLGDGSEWSNLQFLAQGMNIQFCGFQASPSDYYRNADIFIMPSLGPEGLPLVTLEAMSYGLPCILSDLAVHRELCGNGTAAMLFKCGDPLDLRSRLRILLNGESERRNFGRAAYEAVSKRHSPDAACAAYLRAFGSREAESRREGDVS